MIQEKKSLIRVEVAPAVPLSAAKRQTYTYHIPSDMLPDKEDDLINQVVKISFGPRQVFGVITSLTKGRSPYPTKPIYKLTSVKLTNKQIELGHLLATTMQGGLGFTLRLFMPASLTKKPVDLEIKNTGKRKKSELLSSIKKGTYAYLEKDIVKRYKFLKDLAIHNAAISKQTLIIVPEVWMVDKLKELFSDKDKVGFFYAGLSSVKQTNTWHQVSTLQTSVIIGTQKAIFLPWTDLKTVVVEEEQYSSHKLFDQYPRLHNVTGAKQLKSIHDSSLLFTSSFPSLSLYYQLKKKEVKVLHDNSGAVKPQIFSSTFADRKNKQLLPLEFTDKLRQWLRKKEKVLVLYNQRGSWQSAHCKTCSKSLSCPECEAALTIHGTGKAKKLVCHKCAFTQALPEKCPTCRKGTLKYMGVGTEIVEHVLNQLASWNKDLVRIDTDTIKLTTNKKIEKEIEKKHIVMGTSAVFTHIKGQKFDRVVWLFPERGLQYPDFRSYERSYLLLTRLQSHVKGNKAVTIITRRPPLTESVLTEKMSSFYDYQLKERKRLNYPPFSEVVRLTFSGKTSAISLNKAGKVRKEISARIGKNKEVVVRGPFQGFERYRKQKAEAHIILLSHDLSAMTSVYHGLPVDVVDVNPQRII